MKTITLSFFLISLQLFCLVHCPQAAVYRWVDGNGSVHFSDNPETIPQKYKKQAETIDQGGDNKPTDVQVQSGVVQSPLQTPPVTDKGQEYWHNRFNDLNVKLKGLKEGLDIKRKTMIEYRHKWLTNQKRTDRQALNQIEVEIGRDEEQIKDIENQLESLDAEAARNAVPFEWRR